MITALIYMVLAVLSKLSAVFISMPYPVLGGTIITILGVFIGVNLSNLRGVDLASTRNVSIIGMAVFTGLLIPSWMERHNDAIDTGYRCFFSIISICISIYLSRPRWLSWMCRPTGDKEVAGSTPAEVGNILSWRLIMKYFLRSFSPFR